MADLNGKVAIVTGAGQGVGEGIAHALSKLGAKLVVAFAERVEDRRIRWANRFRPLQVRPT